MRNHLGITLVIFALALNFKAVAQDLEPADPTDTQEAPTSGGAPVTTPAPGAGEVEALYDKEEAKPAPQKRVREEAPAQNNIQNLSDLATLAPFSDVAVIQRRFLPKSQRFEASAGAFSNLNNPFFNSIGVSGRLAYYIRERYAVEALVSFATTTTRQVTDDLETKRRITTDNVLTSKGFLGAAFKWNPIYGKITWLNKTIVPFDINFNIGGGLTQTTDDQSAPTLHLGTSQVFAYSKGMAFRWDLIWNMYQAEAIVDTGKKESLLQNDLFLGLGVSFYFPEATYR